MVCLCVSERSAALAERVLLPCLKAASEFLIRTSDANLMILYLFAVPTGTLASCKLQPVTK